MNKFDSIELPIETTGTVGNYSPDNGHFSKPGNPEFEKIKVENQVIYDEKTDSCVVYFDNTNEKKLVKFLTTDFEFIDASVLHERWLVCGYRVYEYPADWRKSVRENGFFVITFVGHLEHVIPRNERTTEQHFFIKHIFEPY